MTNATAIKHLEEMLHAYALSLQKRTALTLAIDALSEEKED